MTAVDPLRNHSATIDAVVAAMQGKSITAPGDIAPPATATQIVEPAHEPVAHNVADLTPPPPEETPPPTPEVVAPPAAPAPKPAAPAPNPAKARLERSMAIQRRAQQAAANARAATQKLRTPAPAPKPEAKPDASAEVQAQLQAKEAELRQIQTNLEAHARLARTDPLGFLRRAGVKPDELARFVADGGDPTKLALEDLRREASQAIANVKREADQKIAALQDQITAGQEVTAQQNFFTFVEEAKDANPEAFAALQSGLVFSDRDIWDTANHLLETRADLRDNFDEDRLLEAVEAEARKDPRWARVQALTANNVAPKKSNAAASKKSNASEKVEAVSEETPPPAPKRERDPQNGQFTPQTGTPFTRHAAHVEQVMRTARLFG